MIPEQHRGQMGRRRAPQRRRPPRTEDPRDPRGPYPQSPAKDPDKERINPLDPGPLS